MPANWEGLERHYGLLFRIFDHDEDGPPGSGGHQVSLGALLPAEAERPGAHRDQLPFRLAEDAGETGSQLPEGALGIPARGRQKNHEIILLAGAHGGRTSVSRSSIAK